MFNGGLWATGGYEHINTSEILIDGVWVDGPSLPEGLGFDRHCLVAINETTAFLIGEILLDHSHLFLLQKMTLSNKAFKGHISVEIYSA